MRLYFQGLAFFFTKCFTLIFNKILFKINYFHTFITPSRLNEMLIDQMHSPIRFSLWLLETVTHFPRPSSRLYVTLSISHPQVPSTPIPEISSYFHSTKVHSGLEVVLIRGNLLNQYYYKKKKILLILST